jgi:hypothetical protein
VNEVVNDIHVIITVQKSGPGGTSATTMTWNLTPGPRVNRQDLFQYVMENMVPEEWRRGVVLFYSAEPLRFAHQPAPETAAEATR